MDYVAHQISFKMEDSTKAYDSILISRNLSILKSRGSNLKSRDITLPTKVGLVKAMVFPIVMYGCQSWTIKKADTKELMLLNCGVGEDS